MIWISDQNGAPPYAAPVLLLLCNPIMLPAYLSEYDFCDFVTFTLAGIAFALCLYVEFVA